ncbi:MAG: CDP-alcohol phosphatidyltransferase family protein [Myxococcota bacterium]|nr:CDP-alcohol phosphatidyltransferase family protein [Myxococcota bacterium]
MRERPVEMVPDAQRASAGESSLVRELARPWNLMSLVRVPLAVLVLVFRAELGMVIALMVLAAVSDGIDGAMARRAKADPAIGAWLDPVCDKAFVVALLAAIWWVHQPAWWFVALCAVREIIVVPLVLAHLLVPGRSRRRIEYRARPSGKATTCAQFVAIGAVLFAQDDIAKWSAIAAAVLGLWAGVEYALRARATLGRG